MFSLTLVIYLVIFWDGSIAILCDGNLRSKCQYIALFSGYPGIPVAILRVGMEEVIVQRANGLLVFVGGTPHSIHLPGLDRAWPVRRGVYMTQG